MLQQVQMLAPQQAVLWCMHCMGGLHVYLSEGVAAGCSSCLQLQQRAALKFCATVVMTVSIHNVNSHAFQVLQHRGGGQPLLP